MIRYSLPEEKIFLKQYAELLSDQVAKRVIDCDTIISKDEAIQFAEFFWNAVDRSNQEDEKNGSSSEYILEKYLMRTLSQS